MLKFFLTNIYTNGVILFSTLNIISVIYEVQKFDFLYRTYRDSNFFIFVDLRSSVNIPSNMLRSEGSEQKEEQLDDKELQGLENSQELEFDQELSLEELAAKSKAEKQSLLLQIQDLQSKLSKERDVEPKRIEKYSTKQLLAKLTMSANHKIKQLKMSKTINKSGIEDCHLLEAQKRELVKSLRVPSARKKWIHREVDPEMEKRSLEAMRVSGISNMSVAQYLRALQFETTENKELGLIHSWASFDARPVPHLEKRMEGILNANVVRPIALTIENLVEGAKSVRSEYLTSAEAMFVRKCRAHEKNVCAKPFFQSVFRLKVLEALEVRRVKSEAMLRFLFSQMELLTQAEEPGRNDGDALKAIVEAFRVLLTFRAQEQTLSSKVRISSMSNIDMAKELGQLLTFAPWYTNTTDDGGFEVMTGEINFRPYMQVQNNREVFLCRDYPQITKGQRTAYKQKGKRYNKVTYKNGSRRKGSKRFRPRNTKFEPPLKKKKFSHKKALKKRPQKPKAAKPSKNLG